MWIHTALSFWNWLNEDKHIEIIGWPFVVFAAIQAFRSLHHANEANELQLLPILAIRFVGKPLGLDTVFVIKNIGEGVAFDIVIEPQSLKFTDSKTEWLFAAYLPKTNTLGKGEEKNLIIKMSENGENVPDSTMIAYAASGFYSEIFITYKNARGTKYFTLIRTSKDSVNIKIPPKRLNFRWQVTKFLYSTTHSMWVNLYVYAGRRLHSMRSKKDETED